jgi:[ribosomal protein S5]-alanine N-acetyltransferase
MITELTEENFLDFKCPYCGAANSFPLDCAGHVRECVNCMEGLIVPPADGEFGKKIPVPITTPRLVLRRLEAGDWKDLLEFMFDDEEEAARWLENDRKSKLTSLDRPISLGVQIRDGGNKIIGCVGLRFTDLGFLEAEISAEGNQNSKYKDFSKEAVEAMIGFCFRDLKLHRLIARCGNNDTMGCQLFEAAGMRREGEFVKHYCYNGEWLNTVWFAILEEEHHPAGI